MSGAHEELRILTGALRREARRRQGFGARRTERFTGEMPDLQAKVAAQAEPVAEVPAPAPEVPVASEPSAPAPSKVQAEPREEPRSETLAQESGPESPSGFPASWGSTPDQKDETARRAELLAQRAAACSSLDDLKEALSDCNACGLCQGRTQTVFQAGTGPARVLFVGEAPGFHEDQQGIPFVGPAGQLLTDIIQKGMGLARDEVVIANVLKCRPPENRDPQPVEKRLCTVWLDRQIELIDPDVIIALGKHAAQHLLDSDSPIGRLRGRVWQRQGRKVIATYHPAYLLRSPSEKKECWKDIQIAMAELGLQRPGS